MDPRNPSVPSGDPAGGGGDAVTRELLIERARALAPGISARAEEAERRRNLPDETVRELLDAGLLRMLQPRRVGGYELPFDVLIDVLPVIGAACTSTAWILGNFSSRNWNIGMWPVEAQNEIWGPGPNHTPDVLACSAYVFPALRAVRTAEGYLLDSVFPTPFSSGVDLAEWNTIAAMLHDERGAQPPRHMQVLLHRSEYKVLDTWYASGLAGTGSKDVLVERVEIPAHRGMLITDTHGGPTPGSAVNPGGAAARLRLRRPALPRRRRSAGGSHRCGRAVPAQPDAAVLP